MLQMQASCCMNLWQPRVSFSSPDWRAGCAADAHSMVPMMQLSQGVFCMCISSWRSQRVEATLCPKHRNTCKHRQDWIESYFSPLAAHELARAHSRPAHSPLRTGTAQGSSARPGARSRGSHHCSKCICGAAEFKGVGIMAVS